MPVAQGATLRDGLLDLLLVPEVSLAKLPTLLADFRAARVDGSAFLRRARRDWIEFDTLGAMPGNAVAPRNCGQAGSRLGRLSEDMPTLRFAEPAPVTCARRRNNRALTHR